VAHAGTASAMGDRGKAVRVFAESEDLDGGGTLPGFSHPVAAVFAGLSR
jgi:hypothetical protein